MSPAASPSEEVPTKFKYRPKIQVWVCPSSDKEGKVGKKAREGARERNWGGGFIREDKHMQTLVLGVLNF